MSEWQPMETAPRDGTDVLGVDCVGFVGVYFFLNRVWFDACGDVADLQLVGWMPLPEPPK